MYLSDDKTDSALTDVNGNYTFIGLLAKNYSVQWNAEKFSSGMYFYRLSVGGKTETKKMILMK